MRGWNWGKAEFTKAELSFNVQNRPAFELPYSEISNTNLAGKNEVAVEFALGDGDGASGQPGSTKKRGKKAAAGPDELVEMRFYIPGVAVKKEKEPKEENGEDGEVKEENEEEEEEEFEELNAANLFYETLMDKAEIGDVAGDTFATFLDILHLTPRYVWLLLMPWLLRAELNVAGVGSISTCTKRRSGYVARHTTTRFSMARSRNSSCFPRMMIPIHSSFWGLTRRSDRVKPGTPSLLCS